MLEMHGLARIGADAGRDEHQPGIELAARRVAGRRQEPAGLLGEVEQDGVGVEDRRVAVDDDGELAVGVQRPEARGMLLALARIDRHGLVVEPRLLEEQRDLHRVGGEVVVEGDHGAGLPRDGRIGSAAALAPHRGEAEDGREHASPFRSSRTGTGVCRSSPSRLRAPSCHDTFPRRRSVPSGTRLTFRPLRGLMDPKTIDRRQRPPTLACNIAPKYCECCSSVEN